MNMVFAKHDFGTTFLVMDSQMNPHNLYEQILPYSILRKYEQRLKTWVGLAADIRSRSKVDMGILLSYPWIKDCEIGKLIK